MTDREPPGERAEQTPQPPELPTHSDDGVDLTLIRWMLSLTPAERLQALQDRVDFILSIRQRNNRP